MDTGAESRMRVEMEIGVKTETWTESEYETEMESRDEFGTEMETETKAKSEYSESEFEDDVDSEIETDTRMETESKVATDVGAETETNDESEHEMETGSRSERRAKMDVVPPKMSESNYETESEMVTDPATKARIIWLEEREYYSTKTPICKRSDPDKPHTFFKVYHHRASSDCFSCKGPIIYHHDDYYYTCFTCKSEFHKGCHHYPPEIRHPFHLQHPLTITFSHPQAPPDFRHLGSERYSDLSGFDEENSDPNSDFSVMKCKCCRRNLGDTYYACSICAFTLHLSCAKFSASLTINRPKAHEHTLTLLPRKISSPCDACGLSMCTHIDPVYACLLCNYMLHHRCIYLPRVIKITRHHHRLAKTSSLPPLNFSCGVCRKSVDINCGQYSCTMGCLYSVHSKCATRKDVWDGKELEDVPLEEEEDIPPFTMIDDQTIRHFNHEHDLRLHGNDEDKDIREEIKFCQSCVLPIISDPFYSCMQCSFILHDACANRSLKIHHPLHVHPLSLAVMSSPPYTLRCDACNQRSIGFLYECRKEYCFFKMDARCASIPEPFNHKSHPDPLYFTLRKGICMRCKTDKHPRVSVVECLECNSFLCLQCVTLPDVAIYKHDRHPVTLCYGEKNTRGTYWCEICEGELDVKVWFYRCQECCLTLHIRCILGVDTHLKPGRSFQSLTSEVNILPNSGNSRPACEKCGLLCKDPQFFKIAGDTTTYCCYDECSDDLWKSFNKVIKESDDDDLDTK